MKPATLLDARDSLLLVVDVQERLAPSISGVERAIDRILCLLSAAQRLDVPVLVTEHYPRGLGPTIADIKALVPVGSIAEKIHFCAVAEPSWSARLRGFARNQIILAGMEAHVCLLQTALGVHAQGYRTFVVRDAIASRDEADQQGALERMSAVGVTTVTTEMVIFEWLARGDTDSFRSLLPLLKTRAVTRDRALDKS